jgi:hypothetical protein
LIVCKTVFICNYDSIFAWIVRFESPSNAIVHRIYSLLNKIRYFITLNLMLKSWGGFECHSIPYSWQYDTIDFLCRWSNRTMSMSIQTYRYQHRLNQSMEYAELSGNVLPCMHTRSLFEELHALSINISKTASLIYIYSWQLWLTPSECITL